MPALRTSVHPSLGPCSRAGLLRQALLAAALALLPALALAQVRASAGATGVAQAGASINDAESAYASALVMADGDTIEHEGSTPVCGAPRPGLPSIDCLISGDADSRAGAGVSGSRGWLGAAARANDGGSAGATALLRDTLLLGSGGPPNTIRLLLDVQEQSLAAESAYTSVTLTVSRDKTFPDDIDTLLAIISTTHYREAGEGRRSWWEAAVVDPTQPGGFRVVDSGDALKSRYTLDIDLAGVLCPPSPVPLPCTLPPSLGYTAQLSVDADCDGEDCHARAVAAQSAYIGITGSWTSANGYAYSGFAQAIPEAPSVALLAAGLGLVAAVTRRRRAAG